MLARLRQCYLRIFLKCKLIQLISFFDALASGTPVILNFGGWMHELVVERKCGLALWRMPIPDVAIEIHTCLNNFNWKDSVSKEALTLAKTYFEPDLLANKIIACY